jgi:hypothetical protein
MSHTDFTAALNDLDTMIQSMIVKDGKTKWDMVALKFHMVTMRIENEKLIEMRKQTEHMENIASILNDISGSAQSMEPKTGKL